MFVKRCKHSGCHNLVKDGSYFCNEHQADLQAYEDRMSKQREHIKQHTHTYNNKRKSTPERNRREHFYHSRQWYQLRDSVRQRDNYLCQYCLRFGIIRSAKLVDHIVPAQVAPELMTSPDNLATCCYACHRRKTDWEQRFYHTGYQSDKKQLKTDILLKNIEELPNFSK